MPSAVNEHEPPIASVPRAEGMLTGEGPPSSPGPLLRLQGAGPRRLHDEGHASWNPGNMMTFHDAELHGPEGRGQTDA